MRKYIAIIVLSFIMATAAFAAKTQSNTEALSSEYPLHFVGLIPAADCTNKYQIDLFANHVYFLRSVCLKEGEPNKENDAIGVWQIDEQKRVVLRRANESEKFFRIINANTIEAMDLKGKRIISSLDYTLQNSQTAHTLEPKVLMRGMYSYVANRASFIECSTGMQFNVAFTEDYKTLERVYIQNKNAKSEAIQVEIEAQILLKEGTDSKEKVPTVVVKKFIKSSPKELCQPLKLQVTLANTYWKLTMLGDKAVQYANKENKEAFMFLRESGEIKGYTGCNSFGGIFEQSTEKLALSKDKPMLMTKRFCEKTPEAAFIGVLNAMQNYKINGKYLELFDKENKTLARFESLYLY